MSAGLLAPGAPRTGPGLTGPALVGALAAVWFLPVSFVFLPAELRLGYVGLVALGGLVVLVAAVRGDVPAAGLVAVGAAVLLVATVASGFRSATVLLVLQVATGFALHRRARRPALVALALTGASAVSLLVDQVTGRHAYLQLFPAQRFTSVLGEGFRARGVLGQAVPAGLLAVVLLAVVLVALPALPPRRRATVAGLACAATAVAAVTTGTRSVLLCLGVLAVLLLLDRVAGHPATPRGDLSRAAAAAVAAGAVLAVWQPAALTSSRLFSWTGLARTDSYEVRSQALSVVSGLRRTCDFCVLVGSGQGDLQARLVDGAAVNGLSTLDNQLVSLYWDFGLLGLALVAAGVLGALLVLRRSPDPQRRAGALGLLTLVVVGFFVEPLYLSTGAVLLGFCLAGMAPAAPARPGVRT